MLQQKFNNHKLDEFTRVFVFRIGGFLKLLNDWNIGGRENVSAGSLGALSLGSGGAGGGF